MTTLTNKITRLQVTRKLTKTTLRGKHPINPTAAKLLGMLEKR